MQEPSSSGGGTVPGKDTQLGARAARGSDPSQAAHYQRCGGGGQVGGFV